MDGYCLAQLLEEEAIELESRPEHEVPRFEDRYCWVCGAANVEVHCKIVCHHCGFMRDCSDP